MTEQYTSALSSAAPSTLSFQPPPPAHAHFPQCHKTHPCSLFEGSRQSCEESLKKFNARRREKRQRAKAEGSVSPRSGSEPSLDAADPFASFLAYSGVLGESLVAEDAFLDAQPEQLLLHGSSSLLGGDEVAWATAHLKLPDVSAASELPPAAQLSSAVRGGLPGGAQLMGCTLREGCLLLSLDLLGGSADAAPEQARRLAETLHSALRGFPTTAGGVLRLGDTALRLGGGEAAAPARSAPPRISIAGLCVAAGASPLSIPLTQSLAAGAVPIARACGTDFPIAAIGPLSLSLAGAEEALARGRGALLLLECELPGTHGSAACAVSDSACVLLSASRTLCDELNAGRASPGADSAVRLLGLALQAGSSFSVRLGAMGACLRLGWAEALSELLRVGGAAAVPSAGGEALALALWLDSAVRHASAPSAKAGTAALQRTGWAAMLGGDGWGGKDAVASGAGAARVHAGSLLQRAAAEARSRGEGGSALVAALAAAEEARKGAAAEGGWRETAALPFVRAAALLLSAEYVTAGDDAPEVEALEAATSLSRYIELIGALARVNTSYHAVVGWLFTLGNVTYLYNSWLYVLSRDSWPPAAELGVNARALAETRLWPLWDANAPSFSPTEVPWEVVTRCTRIQVAFSLFLLTPVYAAAILAAYLLAKRRLPLRLYEPILAGGAMLDLMSYALTEILIISSTGAVIEWPSIGPGLAYAAGIALLQRHGLFTSRVMRTLLITKMASVALPLLLARRPAVMLRNVSTMAQICAVAYSFSQTRRREAAVLASARRDSLKKDA